MSPKHSPQVAETSRRCRPVLDFLTTRYSYSCVLLSRLFFELYQDEVEEERYLLKYVEGYADPEMPAWEAWKRIAAIRRESGRRAW